MTRPVAPPAAPSPWTPEIDRQAGPLYLAIADAIERDRAAGRLAAGARLPPQRELARLLGVDFTTVSRAYAEARRRGLVDGRVGQGTWVRANHSAASMGAAAGEVGREPYQTPGRQGLIDMAMNLPPPIADPALARRMRESISGVDAGADASMFMRYQESGGTWRDREAGAAWLAPRLPGLDAGRVLLCPGAQAGIMAALGALAAPDDAICAADLTYPGLLAAAQLLRLRVITLASDAGGVLPEALEAACLADRPRALYLNPTLSNPTTITMPRRRRQEIIAVARRHGVMVIEDDAYGALPTAPPPAFAALAPDIVIHIASMAKCLAPALRIAWLTAPDARTAARLAASLRASSLMASPLTASIARRWLDDGVAAAVLADIRAETRARNMLARRILAPLTGMEEPAARLTSSPDAFHLWLDLPAAAQAPTLALRLRAEGVAAVSAEAFADAPPARSGLRLGLGVAASRAELERGLHMLADLLTGERSMTTPVV